MSPVKSVGTGMGASVEITDYSKKKKGSFPYHLEKTRRAVCEDCLKVIIGDVASWPVETN
jgi:hypothetical protein